MPRKYPPLTPKEIISILTALGFESACGKGDHKVYELGNWHVEIDTGRTARSGFRPRGMKITIANAGFRDAPDVFYRATKSTAKKIDSDPLTDYELSCIETQLRTGQPITDQSLPSI